MDFLNSVVTLLEKYWPMFLSGIGTTMLIALTSTLLGIVIGVVIGIIRTTPKSKNAFVRGLQNVINALIYIYVEVFRGTPMMVQAMVIYWGYAFIMDGQTLPLIPSAIFIVSINTGAYVAEIVRGGIISIDKGQFEGAQAIGMGHLQTMIYIVMPQVLRNILPAVSNEFVINIKDTSVLNVIGVSELYFQSYTIGTATYKLFPVYAITCVIYFVLTFSVTRILKFIEKKMDGKENYQVIVESDGGAK